MLGSNLCCPVGRSVCFVSVKFTVAVTQCPGNVGRRAIKTAVLSQETVWTMDPRSSRRQYGLYYGPPVK